MVSLSTRQWERRVKDKLLQGRVRRSCLHQRKRFKGIISGTRLQQLVATRLEGLIRSGLKFGDRLEKRGRWCMSQLVKDTTVDVDNASYLVVQSICVELRLLQDIGHVDLFY